MNIFVIIVTYKGHRWYKRCFDSLRDSNLPIQTIVVDNASNDGTIEYIEENYPEIILFKSNKNLGFGQGNNIGLKYAIQNNCDYVFLLNQDAWIEPNTIKELVNLHITNNKFGILSPIHLDINNEEILGGFLSILCYENNVDIKWINDLYFNKLCDIYEAKNLPAASWLIHKETLAIVGGFDPIFFHRGEDDNYLHRIKFHNLKIGLCPKIRIRHDSFYSVEDLKTFKNLNERLTLLEAININDISLTNRIFKSLKHLIFGLFLFNKNKVLNNFTRIRIYIKHFKMIRNSRQNNTKIGYTWLNIEI